MTELLDPDGEPLNATYEVNNRGQVLAYGSGDSVVWERGTATTIEDGPGFFRRAVDISDPGQVVGNSLYYTPGMWLPSPRGAFSWSAGEITELEPDLIGGVAAVNNRGQVLALANDPALVIWRDGKTSATVDVGSGSHGPWDLNDRGRALGNSSDADGLLEAWTWRAGGDLTGLGTLGGGWSLGVALNNRGQITGQSETASGDDRVFLWRNGRMTDLGTLGGSWSRLGHLTGEPAVLSLIFPVVLGFPAGSVISPNPRGVINEWGHVVGTSETASGDKHAFLWRNGRMTDLGTLGGSWSRAYAVNNWGQVVGVSETAAGDIHAFVWRNGRMTDLGTLGEEASYAVDINDWGQIVGTVGPRNDFEDDPPDDSEAYRAVMWTVRSFG